MAYGALLRMQAGHMRHITAVMIARQHYLQCSSGRRDRYRGLYRIDWHHLVTASLNSTYGITQSAKASFVEWVFIHVGRDTPDSHCNNFALPSVADPFLSQAVLQIVPERFRRVVVIQYQIQFRGKYYTHTNSPVIITSSS